MLHILEVSHCISICDILDSLCDILHSIYGMCAFHMWDVRPRRVTSSLYREPTLQHVQAATDQELLITCLFACMGACNIMLEADGAASKHAGHGGKPRDKGETRHMRTRAPGDVADPEPAHAIYGMQYVT